MDADELLEALVKQIDMGNPIDDHGHNFKRCKAYIDAKQYIEREPSDPPGFEGGFAANH